MRILPFAALALTAACATPSAPTDPAAGAGTDDGPCAPGAVGAALTALHDVDDADLAARLALTALSESCPLPPGVVATLQAVGSGSVSVADAATIAWSGFAEEGSLVAAACPVAPDTYVAVANVAPVDRARLVYEGCEFARLGVVSADEAVAVGNADSLVAAGFVAAHPVYVWLTGKGMKADVAKAIVRRGMGLR